MGKKTVIGYIKGGTGKSTQTCQLAVMRALAGKRVAIYDLDRQRSSYNFLQARAGRDVTPSIKAVSAYFEPGKELLQFGRAMMADLDETASKYDDVLVDCGGHDNPALRFAMRKADAMFVPLPPADFDIWVLQEFEQLVDDVASVRADDFRPIIFPCLVSTQTSERDVYAAVREDYPNFDWAPPGVMVSNRAPLRRTIGEGKGLFDLPKPDTKARQELLGLYRLVFGEDWFRAPATI